MFTIGICDDERNVRMQIEGFCRNILQAYGEEFRCFSFESGEALLDKCREGIAEKGIDILFLDIEMQGISGLETRDWLLRNAAVSRIVFITSHTEQMGMAFSMRTIGFLSKPVAEQDIERILKKVLAEEKEQTLFELPSAGGAPRTIRLDTIAYFEADGNYTTIYYFDKTREKYISEVLVMKLGKLEESLIDKHFVRIHKSYLVNLAQVSNLTDKVSFSEIDKILTVGRKYKTIAREAFLEFAARKVREQL